MEDPRGTALGMVQQDHVSIDCLWLRYFANGGDADPLDFEAYVYGLLELDEYDDLILSWAVEEVSPGPPLTCFRLCPHALSSRRESRGSAAFLLH